MADVRLYAVEWDGQDDYLPDLAIDRIGELVAKLPTDGFDVPNMQGSMKSVTATFKFEGIVGPMEQCEALERLLKATTVIRTLHANLVAARVALAACDARAREDGT